MLEVIMITSGMAWLAGYFLRSGDSPSFDGERKLGYTFAAVTSIIWLCSVIYITT